MSISDYQRQDNSEPLPSHGGSYRRSGTRGTIGRRLAPIPFHPQSRPSIPCGGLLKDERSRRGGDVSLDFQVFLKPGRRASDC